MLYLFFTLLSIFFFFDILITYHIQLYFLFLIYFAYYLVSFKFNTINNYFTLAFISIFWGLTLVYKNLDMGLLLLKHYLFL